MSRNENEELFETLAAQAALSSMACIFSPFLIFYCKERCSHLAAVEENHIGATCRERLHICRQSLPLCTRESALDGRQIVEVHRCDQMKVGRTPRGYNAVGNGAPKRQATVRCL